MRKLLEAISLGALSWMLWVTYQAVYSADRLPDSIPTHFDAAGNVNGWGSPTMLLLLPVVALAVYLVITVATRFPSAFHYPVRAMKENRAQLEAVTLRMTSWLKVEVLCLFVWIQLAIIDAARHPEQKFAARLNLVPVWVAAILATVGWHLVALVRAARAGSES